MCVAIRSRYNPLTFRIKNDRSLKETFSRRNYRKSRKVQVKSFSISPFGSVGKSRTDGQKLLKPVVFFKTKKGIRFRFRLNDRKCHFSGRRGNKIILLGLNFLLYFNLNVCKSKKLLHNCSIRSINVQVCNLYFAFSLSNLRV